MKLAASTTIAALAVGLSSAAFAHGNARFEAMDRNHDGVISRSEYRAFESFGRLDRNRDGSITRAEARHDAALAKRFRSADRNRDGRLSRAEYADAMRSIAVARRTGERHASAGATTPPPK